MANSSRRSARPATASLVSSTQLALEPLESRRMLALSFSVLESIVGANSSQPTAAEVVGNALYLSALKPPVSPVQRELYQALPSSSGGSLGLVADIAVGSGSGAPLHLTDVNGTLFFSANNGDSGRELWKLGPGNFAQIVKDIHPTGSSIDNNTAVTPKFTVVGSTLYFAANDGATGFELWKSDGTNAGTVRVRDINLGSGSSSPINLTNVNGTLFFSANDGASGVELWKSDGTEAGTTRVRDLLAGSNSGSPVLLTNVGGTLFFQAADATTGAELWKSDGTEAGTIRLADIRSGAAGSFPQQLTAVGNVLFFTAATAAQGRELWKSDGTVAGTTLVKDILAGGVGSTPTSLTNVGGVLYFAASDTANGAELWKSNGTSDGTTLVKNIRTGNASSSPADLANIGGRLYFQANDGTNGAELWSSDGTDAGTVMEFDFSAGSSGATPNSGAPRSIVAAGGRIYAIATSATTGEELWSAPLTAAAGDFTDDGAVDGADVVLWQRQLGSPAAPAGSGADADADGTVEGEDLSAWLTTFGQGGSAAAAESGGVAAGGANDQAAVDAAFAAGVPQLWYSLRTEYRPVGRQRGSGRG